MHEERERRTIKEEVEYQRKNRYFFFFQAEDGIRDLYVTGVQTCALPIWLGLTGELIGTQEQFRKTYVVRAGRLVEIPEGFSLLAPALFGPLLKSRLFSPWGKLRIMMEPLIPRRRDESDESLAAFVTRRLGRETLVRVAQPLAGGIYTADPAR